MNLLHIPLSPLPSLSLALSLSFPDILQSPSIYLHCGVPSHNTALHLPFHNSKYRSANIYCLSLYHASAAVQMRSAQRRFVAI